MNLKEMFGEAKWLTPSEKNETPYFRGEFAAEKKVTRAEITICGLGMFRLYINGKAADDDLFGTLASDFHEWDGEPCVKAFGEKPAHRVYAKKIDITRLTGENNCVGVSLAPGWYNCGNPWGKVNDYGDVKLCFVIDLTYEDGTTGKILSGEWMRWHESEIISWNMFYGEHHDYTKYAIDGWNRVGFDDSDWKVPAIIDGPETEYMFSDCPPDRVIRYIAPKLIGETKDEFIYDMGENITGTPIVKARGRDGGKLTLRVSERLDNYGHIEEYTNHGQKASFIVGDDERECGLKFCWFGFRYAAVSRNAEIVSCAVEHCDVAVTSAFSSSNSLLDWMYSTYLRTQLDNMHCGIPSDCPHLEKRGYTGDGELVCECVMMMTDSEKFYRKWLGDIADCQDRVSGHVQYTAPYTRCGGGPGGWGCAIAEVPYTYYRMYGDKSVLEDFLPRTMRYFDYLEAHSEDDLVVSDQKGEWCLGDWCTPEKIEIPEPFVNNYFYVKTINRLLEFCRVLGRDDLVPMLEERAEIKKAAMVRKYYDPETGDFAKNVQGANCFAVDLGMGDERALRHLVEHYTKNTWFDTGIFGTDILIRVLFEHGYATLAYNLLTAEGPYSFGHWRSTGCTTFPEEWTYKRSQNHPMFGAVVRYLFIYLLGISQDGAGWKDIVIKPRLADGLDSAEGHITTPNGRVAVRFVKREGQVHFRIEIPEGVSARLECGGTYPLHAGVNEITL